MEGEWETAFTGRAGGQWGLGSGPSRVLEIKASWWIEKWGPLFFMVEMEEWESAIYCLASSMTVYVYIFFALVGFRWFTALLRP